MFHFLSAMLAWESTQRSLTHTLSLVFAVKLEDPAPPAPERPSALLWSGETREQRRSERVSLEPLSPSPPLSFICFCTHLSVCLSACLYVCLWQGMPACGPCCLSGVLANCARGLSFSSPYLSVCICYLYSRQLWWALNYDWWIRASYALLFLNNNLQEITGWGYGHISPTVESGRDDFCCRCKIFWNRFKGLLCRGSGGWSSVPYRLRPDDSDPGLNPVCGPLLHVLPSTPMPSSLSLSIINAKINNNNWLCNLSHNIDVFSR